MQRKPGIAIHIPDQTPITVSNLLLDFTGTLSKDGVLIPGVAARLRKLDKLLSITVATADTFGVATEALSGLPVEIQFLECGKDKARLVIARGASHVAVIGNGRNDVPMFRKAALSIAVTGPEGTAGELMTVADVVVCDVRNALDLLLKPMRLVATLRP